MTFDAVILADSQHGSEVLLGLTLAERGRRVALKAGARRVHVIESPETGGLLVRRNARMPPVVPGLTVILLGSVTPCCE